MITNRKFGYILLGIGLFITAFSLVSDSIGLGKGGIGVAQLILLQSGILISTISIGLLLTGFEQEKFSLNNQLIIKLLNLPVSTWLLIGFLIVYVLLFIIPIFFNTDRRIDYLTQFIPDIAPIGRDLSFAISGIKSWLSGNGFYLRDLNYPPLYAIVFSPFLLLEYPNTYFVMTAITLISIIISTLLLPSLIVKDTNREVILFFFLTSIFSYGMQFEIERGQFNVFAFTISFTAIYIFHRHNQFRHLAYLLISVAIQIKLYPVFFTLMFVKNWQDWKRNILRLTSLGIFNIALLFSLGYKTFVDFINTMLILFDSQWTRPYNHSLASFMRELTSNGLGIFQADTIEMLRENSALIKLAIILYYFLCLIIIIGRAYKNKENTINPDLFLICTLGTMIVPSLSIDYKLPLLSPSLTLVLLYNSYSSYKIGKIIKPILLIIISLAYSLTLFSFVHRPMFLANPFPLLIIILTAITLLNVMDNRSFSKPEFQGPQS